MIKKAGFIAVVVVMLIFGSWAQAGVSIIMNGSFENDGYISDITVKAPYRWCDVNVPSAKFSGWVLERTDWSSHGDYCLIIRSRPYRTFAVNEIATVSQQVYLSDVNEIIFDIKLDTTYSDPWDPSKRTAVLMIDNNVVWESNSVGSDVRGEYFDQVYSVAGEYKDANSHKLSLGIRANVAEYTYIDYQAKWDFVKFNTHCGGFGYLPGDFNLDCYTDMLDLKALAERWLEENPAYKYDLFEDDESIIDFRDFAIFADSLLDCTDWQNDNCAEAELLTPDINNDGVVNLRDFAILAGGWASEEDCVKGDIVRDGVVDYDDMFELSEQWLQRSWLYGLE